MTSKDVKTKNDRAKARFLCAQKRIKFAVVDDIAINASFGAVSWVKFAINYAQISHINIWRAVSVDKLH